MTDDWQSAVDVIHRGGVGVLPTDTLYGLVGSALIPETVDRIYDLKARSPDKPFIVLISDIDTLEQFGVILSQKLEERLAEYWPGPTTVILPTIDDEFSYLHQGTGHIAFRLPDKENLREFIRETGPLVAPSANVEGGKPATTIAEARTYFGTSIEFYIDEGDLQGKASTIVRLDDEDARIVRE